MSLAFPGHAHFLGHYFVSLIEKRTVPREFIFSFQYFFYHTSSSVLVNGNKVDMFERDHFDHICKQIKGLVIN